MSIPVRTETNIKRLPGGKGQTFGVHATGQGIYEASATPIHQVGDRLQLWGDRVFRYGHFVADYTTANVGGYLVAPDSSANDMVVTDDVVLSAGNYKTTAGMTKIEITKASITKDRFKNGTLHITDGTGEGYTYLIKRNSATGSKLDDTDLALAASTSFVLELYDGLVIGLVVSDTAVAIMGNLYDNLIPATTTDICAVGVSVLAIDYSVASYAWVQTWGPCTVLDSGGHTKGELSCLSDAGAAILESGYTLPRVGYALATVTTGEQVPIYLKMAP